MADNQLTVVRADGQPIPLRSVDAGGGLQSQVITAGEHIRVYLGIQNITIAAAVSSLTVPSGATHALIYAEGLTDPADYIRYWQDGSNPNATTGKRLRDHEEMACASPGTFKAFLGSGSGSVILRIEYYRYQ